MADAGDSKSPALTGVPVQVRGPVLGVKPKKAQVCALLHSIRRLFVPGSFERNRLGILSDLTLLSNFADYSDFTVFS